MNALDQINSIVSANRAKPDQAAQSQEALQQAAKQFEAILLMQLTSALNGKSDGDDEDSLFGSDGGSSMANQLFSEQMATTMAESGGVGLGDMIMQKFGINPASAFSGKAGGLAKMMTAIKDIKNSAAPEKGGEKNSTTPLINRSGRITPLPVETFAGDPNDAAVVSTFEDQLAEQAKDTTISPLFREGNVLPPAASGRVGAQAMIAPETAVSPVSSVSAGSTAPVAFSFPVRGRISSGFGNRFHPIDKMKKFHTGLDIAVPKGTRVDAAAEGTVVFAAQKGGYGNLVVIRHPDGKETRYGHLDKLLVSAGDTVGARQQIALSGSTGKSTGPHLHFEIRENGQVLNPLKFLSNVLPKSADR